MPPESPATSTETVVESKEKEKKYPPMIVIEETEPDKILEFIGKNDKEAHQELMNTERLFNNFPQSIDFDEYLTLLAEATRELDGKVFSRNKFLDRGESPLAALVNHTNGNFWRYGGGGEIYSEGGSYKANLSREAAIFLFRSGVTLAKVKKNATPYAVNQPHSDYSMNVKSCTKEHGCLKNNMNFLHQIHALELETVKKGLSTRNTDDVLGLLNNVHVRGFDVVGNPETVESLYMHALYLNGIKGNLAGAVYDALSVVTRENEGIEGIMETLDLFTTYAETLASRGERQLHHGFSAFQFFGEKPTEAFIDDLLKLHYYSGFLNFSRFGENAKDVVASIVHNFENPDPNRTPAVIIMPRDGGFLLDTFSMGNFAETFEKVSGKYQVFVFETAVDESLVDAVKKVHELTGKKPHAPMIVGHGTENTLSFGSTVWSKYEYKPFQRRVPATKIKIPSQQALRRQFPLRYPDEQDEAVLDTYDSELFAALDEHIADDAVVILYSCSNGKGGPNNPENILYQVARGLPGRTVFAAGEDTKGIEEIYFDEDGKMIEVTFLGGEKNSKIPTYRLRFPSKMDVQTGTKDELEELRREVAE